MYSHCCTCPPAAPAGRMGRCEPDVSGLRAALHFTHVHTPPALSKGLGADGCARGLQVPAAFQIRQLGFFKTQPSRYSHQHSGSGVLIKHAGSQGPSSPPHLKAKPPLPSQPRPRPPRSPPVASHGASAPQEDADFLPGVEPWTRTVPSLWALQHSANRLNVARWDSQTLQPLTCGLGVLPSCISWGSSERRWSWGWTAAGSCCR